MQRSMFLMAVVAMIVGAVSVGRAETFTEDFEAGYPEGSNLADHADWFGQGTYKSPTIVAGQGVAGSIGLSPGQKNFHWTAHPLDWDDPTLAGVILQMDFETAAAGDPNFPYDDDRVGWSVDPAGTSSTEFFSVELDGGVIQGRWKVGSSTKKPLIVALPVLSADTFYRLRAEFTKLTDTSARVDVTLTELDAGGDPVGDPVVTGQIPDTSDLGSDSPPEVMFTAPALYPSFKNYNEKAPANADNAYVEIVRVVPDCSTTVTPEADQNPIADVGQPATPPSIDYTVNNVGLQEITYTVIELDDAQQALDVPWLSLNKGGDTVPSMGSDIVTASIDTTGLAGGRHTAYLKFTDDCSPANEHLRRIDLDVFACHWEVDSCSQERSYSLDYPSTLPDDVVYRITNTGSTSTNYTVTKSGDPSECFEWLALTNAAGVVNAGEYVDVIASVAPDALEGHETNAAYACTLTFTDDCSPQVVERKVKLRYLGVGDTQVFVYDGIVAPTDYGAAGDDFHFELYDGVPNGAVEEDPDADNGLVWRMVDTSGLKTWYRLYHFDEVQGWDWVRVYGEAGATLLTRARVYSWGPPGGTRRGMIRIGEKYASNCEYHWGGPDGVVEETKRDINAQSGIGSTDFVIMRLTSAGSEADSEWDCGRVIRLYLNEDPTPVVEILNAEVKTTASEKGLFFGDSSGSGEIDIAFDWVTGTNAGAFAPGEEVAVLGQSLVPTFSHTECPVPFADADEDGDVDQDDYGAFQACFTGMGGGVPEGCECFDRPEEGYPRGDHDIDQDDWGAFEACATGPAVRFDPENPPPGCTP